ncbi:hypothetical protein P167DRAFT_580522 [Morchella conica CCBAS932]|uniref:Uncharacterized protein n=1 Tax=Morchella conica CCBAS932 TaxID=1392247 RepID=A0A3N4K7E3_9PEZI|nr:hypothetical protein P167DRAFT_580522 [Morchella conica CCBAS932]
MPSPTFVDDASPDSPQAQRVRRTIRKPENTASRPPTHRQPRSPGHQAPQTHSHSQDQVEYDSQPLAAPYAESSNESPAESLYESAAESLFDICAGSPPAVEPPSESRAEFGAGLLPESPPEPLMEYDAAIASDDDHLLLPESHNPSFSSSSSSSSSSSNDADNEPMDEPINEPYFDDNRGGEEEQPEDIHNIKDLPYQTIPNINLPDSILKHYALMKVQMDGNVAQDIHRRCLAAVQGFISIFKLDEASARRELRAITGIHHVQYDMCRNNCICFAAFPTAKACNMCKADRKDANWKPYRTFDYIPFTHRLCLLYTDAGYIRETMKYKESFPTDPYTADNPRVSTRDY